MDLLQSAFKYTVATAKDMIKDVIVGNVFYAVEICNIYQAFNETVLQDVCRNTTNTIDTTRINHDVVRQVPNMFHQGMVRFITFRGTPIWFVNEIYGEHDDKTPIARGILYTFNTQRNICILNAFVRTCIKISEKKERCDPEFTIDMFRGSTETIPLEYTPRSLDDVFMPESQMKAIKTAIDSFKSKKSWYLKNGIPYHFGIMLHGPAGTGKTTIAIAIARYIGNRLYNVPSSHISNMREQFRAYSATDNYRVVLIEDIDCATITHSRVNDPDEVVSVDSNGNLHNTELDKPNLANILNAIDGLNSPTQIIYIFTTNHYDKLDPALVRPGRVDLSLEIGYANNETLNQFITHHYGTGIPNLTSYEIKDGLIFAELQVLVMQGYCKEEILAYCKK